MSAAPAAHISICGPAQPAQPVQLGTWSCVGLLSGTSLTRDKTHAVHCTNMVAPQQNPPSDRPALPTTASLLPHHVAGRPAAGEQESDGTQNNSSSSSSGGKTHQRNVSSRCREHDASLPACVPPMSAESAAASAAMHSTKAPICVEH